MYFKSLIAASAALALIGCASYHNKAPGAKPVEEQTLATKAANVLQKQMSQPAKKRIPKSLLAQANCVAVFPSFTKAAFIVGGASGHGLIACRNDASQSWSNASPAIYTISSGSIGFQAGIQSSSVILLFLDTEATNALTASKIKLGADIGIAAGPVGWNASVNGAPNPIVSYQVSSSGLFAGISLSGSKLSYDKTSTGDLYGIQTISDPHSVLFEMNQVPSEVNVFNNTLARYTEPASGQNSMMSR